MGLAVAAGVAALVIAVDFWLTRDYPPSTVQFRLPLAGPVSVLQGGGEESVNYHRRFRDQRWAYDLTIRQAGRLHRGRGDTVDEYYAYGVPVLAPADGRVVRAVDTEPDQGILEGSVSRTLAGNHVVLEVAPGEFLFMGHLRPGSVLVRDGERVVAGQRVGSIGNSGRTPFPHLHIHLQDSPASGRGLGIPFRFHNYIQDGRLVSAGIPTGGAQSVTVSDASSQ